MGIWHVHVQHLFDVPLVGVALLSVVGLFIVNVLVAILSSFWPRWQPSSQNFTYVATVIAGLVLSVASGVLGSPATVQVDASSSAQTVSTVQTPSGNQQLAAQLSEPQLAEFKEVYAWTYITCGLVCLLIFVIPTPNTHELVKGVALTTLGFLITLVGGISRPSTLAVPGGTSAIIRAVGK